MKLRLLWVLCNCLPFLLFGSQTIWIGGSGEWHEDSNWDKGVPSKSDSAIIDIMDLEVIIESDAEALHLYVGEGVELTITSDVVLKITDSPGVAIENEGFMINAGFISLNNVGDGIQNRESLINENIISIDSSQTHGIRTWTYFENNGLVEIQKCGGNGLANWRKLVSTEIIDISQVKGYGVSNWDTCIFNEISIVYIDSIGLRNFDYVECKGDVIISNVEDEGVINRKELYIKDSFKMDNIGGFGLHNASIGSTTMIMAPFGSLEISNASESLYLEYGEFEVGFNALLTTDP